MKKMILTAAVVASAAGANAQLRFGAEIGAQLANLVVTVPDANGGRERLDSRPNLGLRGGLVAQFGITDNISIQPGLLFVMKGARVEEEFASGAQIINGTAVTSSTTNIQSRINLNYIQIPINFQYNSSDNGTGFFVGAGPYVAYGFDGKFNTETKITGTSGSTSVSSTTEADDDVDFGSGTGDDFRNLDFGIGLNAGYALSNGAFVRAFGEYGLTDIYGDQSSSNAPRTKNYGFGLTLGYMIGN